MAEAPSSLRHNFSCRGVSASFLASSLSCLVSRPRGPQSTWLLDCLSSWEPPTLSLSCPSLVLLTANFTQAPLSTAFVLPSQQTRRRSCTSTSLPLSLSRPPRLIPLLMPPGFSRHETEVVACLHAACRATATAAPNPSDGGSGGGGAADRNASAASSSSLKQAGKPRAGRLLDAAGAGAASSAGAASRSRAGGRQGSGGGGRGGRGGETAAVRTSWCLVYGFMMKPTRSWWGRLRGSQGIDCLFPPALVLPRYVVDG